MFGFDLPWENFIVFRANLTHTVNKHSNFPVDSELLGKRGSKGSWEESFGIQERNGICLEYSDTGDSFINLVIMHDVAGPWVKVTWCCIKSDVCNMSLCQCIRNKAENKHKGRGCFASHFCVHFQDASNWNLGTVCTLKMESLRTTTVLGILVKIRHSLFLGSLLKIRYHSCYDSG